MRTSGFIAVACFLAAAIVVVAGEGPMHTKDSFDVVKKNLNDGKAIMLDVREQKEWDAGHLKVARLVPLSKLKVEAALAEVLKSLPKDKAIYLHCRAGSRVIPCAEILQKHGFDVRPLKAGYQALVDAGFEKAAGK